MLNISRAEMMEHPRYVREQRKVAAMLISLLVRNGETPDRALRAALEATGRKRERDSVAAAAASHSQSQEE